MTESVDSEFPPHSFFEGTEKKFEFIADASTPDLRGLGDEYWARIVSVAGAKILSRIADDGCIAYLLSESSMFVFEHKLIMITCGRTRLAPALLELLRVVPPEQVRFFTYERKNEVFPHRQQTSFFEDVRLLHRALPGRAYQFGDQDDHHLYLFHLDRPFRGGESDVTLEILMYGIDERVRTLLSRSSGVGCAEIRRRCGFDDLLPGFRIDDHLFHPRGYSLNAIEGESYWTLHVTPEESSSYTSFETNRPLGAGLNDLVKRTIGIFRPRSFDLVLFESETPDEIRVVDYRLKGRVEQRLGCGYEVRFLNYYRPSGAAEPAVELMLD